MTRPNHIPLWRNSAPGGSARLHAETDESSVSTARGRKNKNNISASQSRAAARGRRRGTWGPGVAAADGTEMRSDGLPGLADAA